MATDKVGELQDFGSEEWRSKEFTAKEWRGRKMKPRELWNDPKANQAYRNNYDAIFRKDSSDK